jgi:hypothetical protein
MIKSFKQARVFALVSGTGDWLIRFAGDLGGDQDAPAGRASDRRKGRLVPIRLPTQPTPPMRRPIKGGRKELKTLPRVALAISRVALAIEEKGAWSRSAYQLSRRRQCVAQLREGVKSRLPA